MSEKFSSREDAEPRLEGFFLECAGGEHKMENSSTRPEVKFERWDCHPPVGPNSRGPRSRANSRDG